MHDSVLDGASSLQWSCSWDPEVATSKTRHPRQRRLTLEEQRSEAPLALASWWTTLGRVGFRPYG